MNKGTSSEKYLVVEQKGWRVVILGLAVALIFSLTFKAVFSPRRIQYEIERALSVSDPRIKSTVEGAYLSLSDGIWPRLAIVIEKLHLQSNDPCLFEVKATIQNLALPVAFSSLLDRTLVFKRIEVGDLELEMHARREGCGEVSLQPLAPLPPTLEAPAFQSPSPNEEGTPSDSLERPPLVQTMSVESRLLRHIVFREVHLHFIEWPLFQWNLKGVEVDLPQKDGEKIHVEGLVTLTSDPTRFPFQGVHARLEMDSDSEKTSAKISGAWREGRVEAQGIWSPNRKDFHWQGSFKQIPWSQLIVLAKVLGENRPLPASSQAWVSGQVRWDHSGDSPELVEINEGSIEGEFGDFVFGKVIAEKVAHSEQWKVEPYKVLVNEVDLDILTKMMGWSEPPSAFDRLGNFDGEAHFAENQLVSMTGVWKDLKIIFSNRGRREFQKVNNINLELVGASNRWSGFLKGIELEQGKWNGNVSFLLDQNSKVVELECEFNQARLAPAVERLMTLNGQLSSLEGRLALKFIDAKLSHIGGFLKSDRGVVDNVIVDRARFDFEGEADHLNGRLQIQGLSWPRSHLSYWPQALPAEYESLLMKNISGRFQKTAASLEIKDVQGLLVDLKSRFQLEMGWTEEGNLHGNLALRGDRRNRSFRLSGNREAPAWSVGLDR